MTAHAALATGPIGPDTIGLPGDTGRLSTAIQGLRDLAREVSRIGQQLKESDPDAAGGGHTLTALTRGAAWTGDALELDAQQLDDLADALQGALDALSQGQGGVDDLRGRWRLARESLRTAFSQAKHGPKDPGPIILGLDAAAAQPHEAQFLNQAGLRFAGGEGGSRDEMMLVEEGGAVQQAIAEYRRDVRGIVDEYAEHMRTAKAADKDVESRLPRQAGAAFSQTDDGGSGDGGAGDDDRQISAPAAVRKLGGGLHEAARALNQATDRLEDIRLAIRAGRMLPEDERVGSNDGFKRDWTDHFDSLRQALNATREAADAAADRLRRIDQDSAAEVRHALRGR